METTTTEDLTQFITEDVIVATARNSLQGECSWEAVDPLHQTIMGGRIQCFLKDVLPALVNAGWIPPGPGYPRGLPLRSHPRGRLREVLKDHLTPRFEGVSRSKIYSLADQVYRWHLGEMRYIRLVSLAREFNDAADVVAGYAEQALTDEARIALEQVECELRDKADAFEDETEDPR